MKRPLKDRAQIYIGTAGWNIPNQYTSFFSKEGSHLERYAQVFNCVEINSSFYRNHKPETYRRWASCVPDDFRFSVKLYKYFIHEKRLQESGSELKEVILSVKNLGEKFGGLLVQLPPSLEFDLKIASRFIAKLRKYCSEKIFWEPRHRSWSSPNAVAVMEEYKINKVLADPERCKIPKKKSFLIHTTPYFRMHGTPKIYKSRYTKKVIAELATKLKRDKATQSWCIFDNTTFGYAVLNAHQLQLLVSS